MTQIGSRVAACPKAGENQQSARATDSTFNQKWHRAKRVYQRGWRKVKILHFDLSFGLRARSDTDLISEITFQQKMYSFMLGLKKSLFPCKISLWRCNRDTRKVKIVYLQFKFSSTLEEWTFCKFIPCGHERSSYPRPFKTTHSNATHES